MASAIDDTKPTQGTATTASVRSNFLAAKNEINGLQRTSVDVKVTTGTFDAQAVDFANNVTLAEGVRILIRVGSLSGTSGTTPTLDVDGTGAKTIVSKKDGSALSASDITAGLYMDLVYDATATKWVWLNK